MNKLKILMYHSNEVISIADKIPLYLGLAAIYLKTYIDTERPELAKQLEWLLPIQEPLSDQELIDEIINNDIDLFSTSNYLWNHEAIMAQLSRIHVHLPPKVKIIAGGPSIDAHKDELFFNKYPFIDYAIYSAGEEAFADIVESLVYNKKLIAFNTNNLAYYDKESNKTRIAPYKYVKQLMTSPYLNCADMLEETVKKYEDKYSLVISYELTRGCPYACTFCDWNSGFDNKVSRRKNTYEAELDLFHRIGIFNLYLADANVGQYQEDVDMIAYLAKKNIEEGARFSVDGNFSKLRKDNNMKIYRLLGKSNAVKTIGWSVSVQDIQEHVLENINRPDVGWEVHEQMIRELKEEFPDITSRVQLIQGLPGQTPETWHNTLDTVFKTGSLLMTLVNELLPNSPAGLDPEYQRKFQVVYSRSLRLGSASNIEQTEHKANYYRSDFVQSCVSFTREDMIKMTILSNFYSSLGALAQILKLKNENFDTELLYNDFLNSEHYEFVYNNLYDNWYNHDKFMFNKGFGPEDNWNFEYSACRTLVGFTWALSPSFIKFCLNYYSGRVSSIDFEKHFDNTLNKRFALYE